MSGNTLAVHMIFGGLAVLLIPLQVSRMWRRGDRRKHVYLGWALVPVVSIAALTTPPISFNMSYPFWSEAGFALGSVAWFIALVMGIHCDPQGRPGAASPLDGDDGRALLRGGELPLATAYPEALFRPGTGVSLSRLDLLGAQRPGGCLVVASGRQPGPARTAGAPAE
jgi:hypothetical protein